MRQPTCDRPPGPGAAPPTRPGVPRELRIAHRGLATLAALVALAAAVATATGCEPATASRAAARGTLVLRLADASGQPLAGSASPALSQQPQRPQQPLVPAASVIAAARLEAAGRAQTLSISVRQRTARFTVAVPQGEVRFVAQVLGNTGVPLFTGEATTRIDADDFQVTVPLRGVAPVLAVAADTIRLGPNVATPFLRVLNPGSAPLTWAVDSSSPALRDCAGRCFAFNTTDVVRLPSVPAGGVEVLPFSFVALRVRPATTRLRLTSAQGYVDVVLVLGG